MAPNPQETADLVTFTEEIRNGKHPFFVQCQFSLTDQKINWAFLGILLNINWPCYQKV